MMGSFNKTITTLKVKVNMVTTSLEYGFEYLGNQTRLVITPLTERCYRTLMGALKLNLGGSLQGPAGQSYFQSSKLNIT